MNCFLATALLIAVLGVHSTEAIKCYVCASTSNSGVCYEGGTALEDSGSTYQTSCGSYDRCVVSKTDSTISRSCSTVAICDGYGDVDGYSCCEGDLCNSGSGVHSTEALKCYTCAGIGTSSVCYEGGTALEDEGSRYTSSCGTLDRCLVAKTDSTISRSCSTEAICDGYDNIDGYSCCEGDLCNSGSGVHSTEAIKCYTCSGIGTSSVCYEGGTALEDTGSTYQTTCASLDRCVVAKTDSTISRSCSSEALCDGYGDVDGYSCCEGDYCNSGSTVYDVKSESVAITFCGHCFMFMAVVMLTTILFQKL